MRVRIMLRMGILRLLSVLGMFLGINGLCDNNEGGHYERFQQAAKDYETGIAFLKDLGTDDLFALCADYGKAVETGDASEESLLVEECLRILREKDALSSRVLLEVAQDRSHPILWRILAARYASGKAGFVTLSIQDIKLALETYMQLIAEEQAPVGLRCEACSSASRVILQGYERFAEKAVGEGHLGDVSVRRLLRSSDVFPYIKDHNERFREFIRLLCRVAVGGDAPPSLQDRIPAVLRSLVRQCGLDTPGLDLIKDAMAEIRKERTELSRAYLSLLQELERADAEVKRE